MFAQLAECECCLLLHENRKMFLARMTIAEAFCYCGLTGNVLLVPISRANFLICFKAATFHRLRLFLTGIRFWKYEMGSENKGKKVVLFIPRRCTWHFCSTFLKFSAHFRHHEGATDGKKWFQQQSQKGTPVKWPSFLCTPHPPPWFPASLPLMFLGKDQSVESTGLAGGQSREAM